VLAIELKNGDGCTSFYSSIPQIGSAAMMTKKKEFYCYSTIKVYIF